MNPEIGVKTEFVDGLWGLREWTARRAMRIEPASFAARNKAAPPGSQPHVTIAVAQRYGAPPAQVFRAWLDPKVAGRWLFATASQPMARVEIDGRLGGSFCFVERQAGDTARYTGQYLEIVPNQRLAFTLSVQPHPNVFTRVTVTIAPFAKGCALNLIHENVPRDYANYMEGRWTGILYGLGVTLDPVPERSTTIRSQG